MRHTHIFDEGNPLAERGTLWALLLTSVTMVAEIAGGWYFNSMAVLADGWHMSSHALALGLSLLAYVAARRYARDPRFAFGTWKIEVLAGYTSAILLVLVVISMAWQSIERLLEPASIHFDHAILLAVVGLLVNLVCVWLLKGHSHAHEDALHHHPEPHDHHHDHHHHHDLNLRAAYVHVLADAATSVLAIVALIGGKFWGLVWLDPVMGIVGAVLVALWSVSLMRDTGRILLDAEMDAPVVREIQAAISAAQADADLTDLHVWRVGKGKYACIVALSTLEPVEPAFFKDRLQIHEELVHITVEVNPLRR